MNRILWWSEHLDLGRGQRGVPLHLPRGEHCVLPAFGPGEEQPRRRPPRVRPLRRGASYPPGRGRAFVPKTAGRACPPPRFGLRDRGGVSGREGEEEGEEEGVSVQVSVISSGLADLHLHPLAFQVM